MNEVLKFPINTPVEVTQQSEAGTHVEGRYGEQVMYSLLDNPDVADVVNTIQKMAQKRALVAATLIATSASEFFTQDVEDADPLGRSVDTGAHAHGTREAQEFVRERKLEELRAAGASSADADAVKPWRNFGEMRQCFERVREQVGETRYFEELELAGVQTPGQFKSAETAFDCYSRLARLAAKKEVA